MNLNCDGRGAWLLGVWAGLGPCGLQPRALVVAALFDALSILVRFAFGMRGCALVSRLRSPIVDISCDAQGGRGGWSAGLARAVAPLLSPRSLRRRSAQPGLFVVVYTCARASFCGLAVCGIVHLVAVVRNAAPRCLVCAGRALSRARRELAARWALPSWVGCMRSVACVCVRSALAGARVFRGVDRAVPRAAAPG